MAASERRTIHDVGAGGLGGTAGEESAPGRGGVERPPALEKEFGAYYREDKITVLSK